MSDSNLHSQILSKGVAPVTRVTTTHTMAVYEQNILIDTPAASFTLTLPPVGEAAGKLFSIFLETTNSKVITLQDQDDSVNWEGDYTLDATNDGVVLYSDGRHWCALFNTIA